MDRLCPVCRKITRDDRFVRCPECGSLFNAFANPPYPLTSEQEDRIYKKIHKRLIQYVFGSFSILALISFILMMDSLMDIYERSIRTLNSLVISEVSKQFQEPRIKTVVQQVASDQAKTLLSDQIRPEVEGFQKETRRSMDSFKLLTNGMESRYSTDYARLNQNVRSVQTQTERANALTSEMSATVYDLQQRSRQYEALNKAVSDILDDLKRRERINDLSGKAIVQADRAAYQELQSDAAADKNESIRQLAMSEVTRVKAFWASPISRTEGTSLHKNGKEIKASDLNTCELMQSVRTITPEWAPRLFFVRELGHRKQVGVPDTLQRAIRHDPNLDVVREAVSAWHELTGFKSPDVFDEGGNIDKWWMENRETFSKQLKPPKCD